MLPDYADIRALSDRGPNWFDENGVPRYAPFHPKMLGVYDHHALLVKIRCQRCRQVFLVGEGWPTSGIRGDQLVTFDLAGIAERYHYGDPPAHGGCVGNTMNSEPLRIVQAWTTQVPDDTYHVPDWRRIPELEKDIVIDW